MNQAPSMRKHVQAAAAPMTDYTAARDHMVECQIRPDRVRDPRILMAMGSIARERFVSEGMRACAYADLEMVLSGTGAADRRVLLSPRVLARLAEVAGIEADHSVLDVGCGSGYSSAMLAKSAQLVVGLEEDPALAERAEKLLLEEECNNVGIVIGPLVDGHEKLQPYDVIVLQGSVPAPPEKLLNQLTQGGSLVCVWASRGRSQGRGGFFVREGDRFSWFDCFDAAATPLPGFASPPAFHFPT